MPAVYTKPARSCRNNELYGDMMAWNRAHSADNHVQMERLHRNLRKARSTALSPCQQEYFTLYFDQGLSMSEIARRKGVSRSSVSHTIARGREILRKYLQYSF